MSAIRRRALKGRNTAPFYFGPSGLNVFWGFNQGRRARFASHLPLAFIFRAVGAFTQRNSLLVSANHRKTIIQLKRTITK
jgi:hypothetical protein